MIYKAYFKKYVQNVYSDISDEDTKILLLSENEANVLKQAIFAKAPVEFKRIGVFYAHPETMFDSIEPFVVGGKFYTIDTNKFNPYKEIPGKPMDFKFVLLKYAIGDPSKNEVYYFKYYSNIEEHMHHTYHDEFTRFIKDAGLVDKFKSALVDFEEYYLNLPL